MTYSPPNPLDKSDGRSEKYLVFRALERLDPRSMFGKPWVQLTFPQQIRLLAYSDLRLKEENPGR